MVRPCCQFGCTAQLVSESAQRGDPDLPRAQRRVLDAVLPWSLCASMRVGCGCGRFCNAEIESDFGALGSPSASYPVLCSGSRFGAKPAPCGSASFCFDYVAPAGSRFLPKQV